MKRYLPQLIELFSLGSVIVIGDGLVQRIEYHYNQINTKETTFQFDYKRSLGMGITGLFWVGPLTMAWFPFLHRYMSIKMPHLIEGSLRYVLTKMILENICLAGPCCLGFFVIPSKVEGGERWNTVIDRLKSDFGPTLLTDIFFWTLVSPFNYKFTSVKYQPAISCILGGVEAGGLSYLTHLEDIDWNKLLFDNNIE